MDHRRGGVRGPGPCAASGIEDRRPNVIVILANDPKEARNRIADEPVVARRLLDAVLNRRKSLP
jgi:hypothetical protein